MRKYGLFVPVLILLLATVWLSWGCQPAKKPEGDRKYKSEPTISLYDNQTGQKKQIKLEEYVAGVVAAEMEPSWPVNALAAQAILARTFTMENMATGRVKKLHGTDVSTSVEESQAYDPSRITERVRQAVQKTRGEVITYQGKYIKAWFSASNGGKTAGAAEGLAYYKTPTPYIKANLDDPDSLQNTLPEIQRWTATIPGDQVRQAVKSIAGQDPGPLTSAAIAQRGPSGRTVKLKINNTTVGGPAFRLAAGSTEIRSMFLTEVAVQGGNLILAGKGYGHGVGMSQWGAKNKAEKGVSPEDIIRFYFQDIEIEKLYP
ncbi:SpoIID/LytB domain-containing protein [Desulforamulus hydrothermalis]|uniref:SpoIID/LytB domain protein n=1 Tax=Desulforamulus hydrothermalis Lam5 = DSM 18033 TaxID=1121428 RepID=K8DZW9_9FIRM|nr:SpoIID/LytB domain-containing protein [Desulforamulus hydrothermalis]CCO08630.1 SpoIID/LytB domain protein [Desulforamulus hydrothermalis Lam5 = DSM 18033]SHH00790.1 stage II sporulation protein D [Desulforamulus hydrothermalis Lam5 = DSM 18033]